MVKKVFGKGNFGVYKINFINKNIYGVKTPSGVELGIKTKREAVKVYKRMMKK